MTMRKTLRNIGKVLQTELKKEIKEKTSSDEVKLSELIDYVNDYAKPTEHLNCQSFDELMKKLTSLKLSNYCNHC